MKTGRDRRPTSCLEQIVVWVIILSTLVFIAWCFNTAYPGGLS